MAIAEGQKIPDVKLKTPNADGMPEDITTGDLFGGKKVVLFAVPGAFTPLCSAQHLPGFIDKADEIKAKGVDSIVCMAVNDAFVMGAWAKDRGAGDKVVMLADGNAELTKALGLEMDVSVAGLGLRAQRFALIVDDGVVTKLAVEAPQKFEVSSADAILAAL
jgi:peroxiredoxin